MASAAAALMLAGLLTPGIIEAAPAKTPGKPLSVLALEKELDRYHGLRSLSARFEQVKNLKAMQVKLKSSGSLRMERKADGSGAEVEWEVTKPSFLKLRITEKSLELFEQPGGSGRPLLDNQEAQAKILRPLYAWLTMNGKLIAGQYDVFPDGKGRFRLLPKDKESPVTALRLELGSGKFVEKVVLEERSGDELRISFSQTKAEKAQ